LIGVVACERLFELRVARRNGRAALARGGREYGAAHFPAMVALHTAFLIACPVEVLALHRPFLPWLAGPAITAVLAAQALRYWCVLTLGDRWNVRIVVVPNAPLSSAGPYRWLRHPNYLAVAVEMLALPLVHSAWLTAAVFSLANAAMLRVRIHTEDAALGRRT
jgi:methyltransferase